MPQPLVSIVTPVYNEERFLEECIESVLAQSYDNWDYTIVDNCSSDASLEIASRYAAIDRRINVVRNQRFLQALPNCNEAVRQISPASKYCKIVFGDDWMFPECLERMVDVAERYPSVSIVSAYALEGQQVTLTGLPYQTELIPGREACRKHFLDRLYIFGTQSSVLYRADLVRSRDPLFDESNVYADTAVCFDLLRAADLGFVHQVLTFTRVRPGSLYANQVSMGTSWAARLRLLITYGPTFLTQSELQTALSQHLHQYYRFLGKSLMLRHEKTFWDYHKQQLTLAGVGYSKARTAKGMVATIADAALNPKNTFERLMKRGDV
jgi:glycosyltransferase involved in cell wall biosynthesis